jgi:integrase
MRPVNCWRKAYPGAAKRAEKIAQGVVAANTVAREFHALMTEQWSAIHARRWIEGLVKDVFPYIGRMPIANITAPVVLDTLRRVEQRGAIETLHKLRQSAGQTFRYGIQTGRCERDPVADLRGALRQVAVKHMPAILEPAQVGALMRAIWDYQGQPVTRAALQLTALLFQRPGNIRAMEWAWIDFDAAMLTIPAQAMKRRIAEKINGRPHLVPLAPQAVAILRDLRHLTGTGRYMFPSLLTGQRPMSENTMNTALKRLGYSREMIVPHGFRSMARTLAVERLGINADVMEAQLTHGKSGPLGQAYDRAEYMEQRKAMMRTWADYLDKLRMGGQVIPFPASKRA